MSTDGQTPSIYEYAEAMRERWNSATTDKERALAFVAQWSYYRARGDDEEVKELETMLKLVEKKPKAPSVLGECFVAPEAGRVDYATGTERTVRTLVSILSGALLPFASGGIGWNAQQATTDKVTQFLPLDDKQWYAGMALTHLQDHLAERQKEDAPPVQKPWCELIFECLSAAFQYPDKGDAGDGNGNKFLRTKLNESNTELAKNSVRIFVHKFVIAWNISWLPNPSRRDQRDGRPETGLGALLYGREGTDWIKKVGELQQDAANHRSIEKQVPAKVFPMPMRVAYLPVDTNPLEAPGNGNTATHTEETARSQDEKEKVVAPLLLQASGLGAAWHLPNQEFGIATDTGTTIYCDVFLHNPKENVCVYVECKLLSQNGFSHALGQVLRYEQKHRVTQAGELTNKYWGRGGMCTHSAMIIATDSNPSDWQIADAEQCGVCCWWPGEDLSVVIAKATKDHTRPK